MKKFLALALALVMLLSATFVMASCDKEEDVLVCGVTIFENMNEQDENGNWTGFESEFAMAVGEIIDMKVEFQIIDWSQKYSELTAGKIDCIWNGFTANASEEDANGNLVKRSDLVDFSYSYMLNQQCVVVRKDKLSNYTSEESLVGKTAAVEGGSAGATYAKKAVGENGKLNEFSAQNATFMEVKGGKSDFAVVDILLAQNICGKGDFADLTIVDSIELDAEYYAIGFKKGSDLTAKVNAAIKELEENGTLKTLAKKYGFENVLKVSESFE